MKPPDQIISTIKHPAVAAARQSLAESAGLRAAAFLAEGHEMVSQAMAARAPIEKTFFLHPLEGREESALLDSLRGAAVECHLVTKGVFFRILGLGYETSARVLATVSARPLSPLEAIERLDRDACLLVGESIQDPRNVGVLIRTADGHGVTLAAFSQDSADPYSRASVRSTTGSIFRVPVTIVPDPAEFMNALRQKSVRIIGTSAQAATPCWQAELSPPCAVLVGNETVGLSPEAREACDLLVTIPMSGGAHSFNVTVAAGTVLYEVARQRAQATSRRRQAG